MDFMKINKLNSPQLIDPIDVGIFADACLLKAASLGVTCDVVSNKLSIAHAILRRHGYATNESSINFDHESAACHYQFLIDENDSRKVADIGLEIASELTQKSNSGISSLITFSVGKLSA